MEDWLGELKVWLANQIVNGFFNSDIGKQEFNAYKKVYQKINQIEKNAMFSYSYLEMRPNKLTKKQKRGLGKLSKKES